MIDKEKVLPLIQSANQFGHIHAAQQRDADWERVKPLIEALEAIANFQLHRSDTPSLGLRGCQELARFAIAALGKEKL